MRLTLQQVAESGLLTRIGLCTGDYPRMARAVDQAQRRLIMAAGENGWWGGWAKTVFNVVRSDPYITLPAQFARMIAMDVCRQPVKIQNEWYEFLEAGIGLQTECNNCSPLQSYERGTVSTAYDLTSTNQKLRIYPTDVRDVGKRVLISGAKDANGNGIYTQDVNNPVIGFMMTLQLPFTTSDYVVTSFTGIQKSETYGDVVFKQVDATSGAESLLARYEPKTITPQYRRYYLHGLPQRCCVVPNDPSDTVRVTTMLKYEWQPVSRPTDFLLIGNLDALVEECQAVYYAEMDDLESQAKVVVHHNNAIRLLNAELRHYQGVTRPAVAVSPWGTAHLNRRRIGTLV